MINCILIFISFIFLIYFCFVLFYTRNPLSFSLIWLVSSIGLLGMVLFRTYFFNQPFLIFLSNIFLLGILIFLIAVGIYVFFIIHQIYNNSNKNIDYLIILGASLRGELLTKSLQFRLETAYNYMQSHPNTIAIVSGGKGDGETITEAQAMYTYLIEKGISSSMIRLEESSTNTYENLLFSQKLLPASDITIGIVTNNFHLYRAMGIGKKLNMKNLEGLPAPTDPIIFTHFMIREVFALIKDKLVKHI